MFNFKHLLQDHMRKGGDVCFSQVFRDGNGKLAFVSVSTLVILCMLWPFYARE